MMKKITPLLIVLAAAGLGIVLSLGSFNSKSAAQTTPPLTKMDETAPSATSQPQESAMPKQQWSSAPAMTIDVNKTYTAHIDTTLGPIDVVFFPKDAPKTVNSFIFLAKQGFYNGLIFHRVIPGFMIQGGDPTGTGMGGPGYNVPAEFNDHKHLRGILSMARSSDPDSAGSQFFIVQKDSTFLDHQYTVFGQVTSGLDTVDKIVNLPRDGNDRPNDPPSIKSITIQEK
ncbi:MAG TPA: peptidylprolyl isomerase [Tepidisphaeraceae bacterium]|jgi:peptidyl-prolyl cis-trans isomerase B (cyclophilin B)